MTDILREAARALREETDVTEDGAEFSRARLMATVHARRRRRMTRLALGLPMAAILAGSTAFAAAGGSLPGALGALAQVVKVTLAPDEPVPSPVASAATATAGGRAPQASERAAAVDLAAIEAAEAEARAAEAVAAAVASAERDSPPPAQPRSTAPTPAAATPSHIAPAAEATAGGRPAPRAPDPSEGLYRAAHRAHFEAQDPAAALAAWESYLRAAPGGRFAAEAAYNRALCLVRLGRSREARAALEPFASGRYGGYRQAEAQELIDALGGPSRP